MKGKSTKSEYPHSGHRQRLKERFRREGLGGFEDHQALELLLFYAIPRRDTNELAHRLLAAFGSLKNVFAADVGDLQSIEGLGEHAAALLKLIPEIAGKYWFAEEQDRAKITSIGSAASYAKSLLYGRPMEHFYVICLDTAYRVKSASLLSKGSPTDTPVYIRHIAEAAFRSGTDKVFVAHNHPGGDPKPSAKDIEVTLHIKEALDALSIQFLDHIIIAEDDYFSFVAEQLVRGDFTKEQAVRASYRTGVMQPFFPGYRK